MTSCGRRVKYDEPYLAIQIFIFYTSVILMTIIPERERVRKKSVMISLELVGEAPLQVLANHDHFRDMNRMFWEWRGAGIYTDLELICQV